MLMSFQSRDRERWVRVVPVARGLVTPTHAIRAADSDVAIVHVEESTHIVATQPHLQPEASLQRELGSEDGKDSFLRRMSLVRLDEQPDGSLRRTSTPAAADFQRRSLAATPAGGAA